MERGVGPGLEEPSCSEQGRPLICRGLRRQSKARTRKAGFAQLTRHLEVPPASCMVVRTWVFARPSGCRASTARTSITSECNSAVPGVLGILIPLLKLASPAPSSLPADASNMNPQCCDELAGLARQSRLLSALSLNTVHFGGVLRERAPRWPHCESSPPVCGS